MNIHKESQLKGIRLNRKTILICPYDHVVERVTNETVLPINHIHNCKIYECIPFKRVKDVIAFMKKNPQLKVK